MIDNRFRKVVGVFTCDYCKKKTRGVRGSGTNMCKVCDELTGHENDHADNDYPNDDCGSGHDCLVKNYTKEQRWWL